MWRRIGAAGFGAVVLVLTSAGMAVERLVPSQYPTIQKAINASRDGDVVIVAPGTYTGGGNRDIDFKGKAITVRSENGPVSCIIDCQGTKEEPHRGFCFYNGEANDSVVEGFTITNGYAGYGDVWIFASNDTASATGEVEGQSSFYWDYVGGGAIACINASPVISHCIIRGNTAGQGYMSGGGGIACGGRYGGSSAETTVCLWGFPQGRTCGRPGSLAAG
jgi:hypothetical protein